MVLQADVPVLEGARRIGVGEIIDLDAFEQHLDAFALDPDLEGVPPAGRVERLVACGGVGRLEAVDGAGGLVGRVRGVDLNLLAVVDRTPTTTRSCRGTRWGPSGWRGSSRPARW
ncbi:hypothetical protein, partial [Nonomuraea composti]|uniref:hypothetical protein n=1 Tax=Nonomuraea composti TaxID=2720023 RepID=UPI00197DAD22